MHIVVHIGRVPSFHGAIITADCNPNDKWPCERVRTEIRERTTNCSTRFAFLRRSFVLHTSFLVQALCFFYFRSNSAADFEVIF